MKKQSTKNKWIKITILSLSIFIILSFLLTLLSEYNINKNVLKRSKDDKYLLVKYTLANKEILPEDADVGDMWQKYPTSLFTIIQDYIKLEKDGNYYIADFSYVNKDALGKITSTDFALNNNNGVVLNDAIFDKEKMIAKIPVGYYEKFKDQSSTPVQVQILSLTSKKKINNVKISYKKNSFFTKTKKNLIANVYDLSTYIPTVGMKKAKKYDKEDIEVYVNGIKYITNKKNSKFYDDSGVIEIGRNPLLINNVEIKVNKKNLFTRISDKLLGIDKVKADTRTFDQMQALGTIAPNSFDFADMQTGYTYYFGGESSGGSGRIITLTGGAVINPPINSSNIPSNYNLDSNGINNVVNGYNYSYNYALYGSSGAESNASTVYNSVVSGNTSSKISDGEVQTCTNCGSNATRVMQLPTKVAYGCSNASNMTQCDSTYDFDLRSAWRDYDGWVALFCGHVSQAANISDESEWENWIGMTILNINEERKYIVVAFSTYYKYGNQTGYGIYKFNYTEVKKKDYYCFKVRKIDQKTNEVLPGATFSATINGKLVTHSDSWDGSNDGYTTFFTGESSGNFTVNETSAPEGYAKTSSSISVTASKLPSNQGEAYCKTKTATDSDGNSLQTKAASASFTDLKLLLNWYKVTENGSTRANGAKFKVKQASGSQYIQVSGTETVTDASGSTKTCYKYSGLGSEGSTLESTGSGEACISRVPSGNYTIIETNPAPFHTFESVVSKTLSADTSFRVISDNTKFVNEKTRFEFTKSVSSGDTGIWSTITTQQLKKIAFNIYDSNGRKLTFIKDSNGVYQYSGNTIDGPGTTGATEDLYLNDVRKFVVEHLPVGTYSVKEKGSADGTCNCTDDSGNCVGFYYPKYTNESDYKFTITNCSNSSSNSSVCTTHQSSTQRLQNVPTEIHFTKADLYSYEDASDIVDFENDKERNDFDKIVFKLKDSNGNYMNLIKIGNHGTCLTDDSYAEYRYVSDEYLSLLTDEERANLTQELHTCGGHIRITHLCRNKKYYIEEVSVPEDSVFTLPENEADRTREYNIPCCGDTTTPSSSTQIINDKGTRVRFEKRDSKYNYLIPDETTTFQVYQCKKGKECNPADSSNPLDAENVRQLMKFSERAVITNDEEDPQDAEGLAGVEVYNAMSDSDVQSGKRYVTDLHPYHGILVLRYLPAGYNYVLLETVAPKNYTLPKGRDAQTKFTVVNNTVNVDKIDMPNVPTSLLIRKYSDDGKLLKGARFKIYEGTTCDANLSAMNQPKTELKLKTIRDGVYEARPETDTNIIQTCDDDNGICSSIPLNQVTKLTYTYYLGTWADFDNVVTEENEKIELAEGEALVQYLEYNHCYIIEEVRAPKGYSLPKKDEDRFTMITIEENEKYAKDTYKTLVNTPTPFTFYKFDEFNNLIDGAEFKLQKLDDNKKYHDLTVTMEDKDGELYYKVDEESDNKIITTKGGKATVYYLEKGQYRILETKPAPGKELGKNSNVATFFVDDNGNVYGNAIISNKAKTDKLQSSSQAEFIIGPRTGITVIKYGLIIAILVAIISGLMILQKRKK